MNTTLSQSIEVSTQDSDPRLKNHWRWLHRWNPEAQAAIDRTCALFPERVRSRGIARSYYQYLWTLEQILRFMPNLRGRRIIDVGCGAGVIPLALRYLGADVTALDRFIQYESDHDNQMGSTAEILDRFAVNGIKAYKRDFLSEGMRLPEGEFDLVTFFDVIEHLPSSPKETLEQLFHLVRPGGYLVVTTPNHAWVRTRVRLLLGRSANHAIEEWWEPPFFGHVREYTAAELKMMLSWTGFDVEHIALSSWTHASSRELSTDGQETWTTKLTLNSVERLKVAGSLALCALVPSLRYVTLGVGQRPPVRR